jgi:two-component system, cell cycle sensor histidine kinase and response regulator CckA
MRPLLPTFRGRILFLGILALALVLGMISVEVVRDYRASFGETREGVADLSEGLARELDRWVQDARNVAGRMAQNPAIRSLDPSACLPWIGEAGLLLPAYPDLLVVNAAGVPVCSASGRMDVSARVYDRLWFRMVREEGRFVVAPAGDEILPVRVGEAPVPVVVLAEPILDEAGGFLGAVAVPLPLSGIQERLPAHPLVDGAVISVMDSSGIVLADSRDPEAWVGTSFRSAGMEDPPQEPRAVSERRGMDGVDRVWGYFGTELAPWTVSSGVPRTALMAPVRDHAMRQATVGLVVLFLLGVGLLWADRTIRRGFRVLQRGAQEAGQVRGVRMREEGPREFREVAEVLNRTLAARDQAEGELASALERHELVLRATRDMIWDWNPATGEVQRNEALKSFTGEGGPAADTGGSEALWFHHIPEPDRSRVRLSLQQALEGGDSIWIQEYRMERFDGTLRRILDRGYVVRNEEGTPIRVVGIMSDVTEARTQAEEVRRAKDRYESILRHAPFGVFLAGADGVVLEWNLALEAMLGEEWEPGTPGRCAEELFLDPRMYRELLEDAEREGTVMGREALWTRADGEEIFVRLTASFFLGEGRPTLEVLAEDVTERRRMGEQMRQVQKMEAVGRLAGGVAHDFNNLLTVISGEARLLLSGTPPPEMEDSLEAIREAGDRGAALTRQLLAFSRRQVTRPLPLDLNEVVDRIHRMLTRLLGEQVRLRTELSPDLPAVVMDPGEVEQVIMNLALNARDAMPEGGTLVISTSMQRLGPEAARLKHPELTAGRYVVLAMADEGTGIDPEVVSRIFEPFFTTKPVGKGTGLGLATVYGIVNRVGGRVVVSSRVGEGSVFRIFLPAAPDGAEVLPDGVEPSITQATAQGNLMVVEDEDSVRRMATRILNRGGYVVRPFATPASALAAIRDPGVPIDLLLTDVKMPGMSGEELAKQARRLRPDLPVLFISGYPEEADIEDRLKEGGAAFLPKPFTPEALLEQIRLLLEAVGSAGRRP